MNKVVSLTQFRNEKSIERIQNLFEQEFFELTDYIFEEWIFHDNNETLDDFFTQQCGVKQKKYSSNLQALADLEAVKRIEGLSTHAPGATKSNSIGFVSGFFCSRPGKIYV